MTQEEKARAYDKALERARDMLSYKEVRQEDMEYLFSELAEPKDEKIRKAIICGMNALKNQKKETFASIPIDDCIAWLEKQGENYVCKVKIGETYKCIASPRYTCFRTGDIYHVKDNFVAELINLCSGCFMLLEKQGEQKPYGQREECLNCQFNYARECKGFCQMKRDEQKPTDKVEPKFKIGDIIIKSHNSDINKFGKFKITGIKDDRYWYNKFVICEISEQDEWELVRIEPKFKVGDWVVDNCGYAWKIEGILNQFYILEGVEGSESRPTIEWVDKTLHLWTIKDAKDGDILTIDMYPVGTSIFIFKSYKPSIFSIYCYCFVNSDGDFKKDTITYYHRYDVTICPATKEQRDLLFKKMKEAGYTFGFEKKELEKIEQNNTEEYIETKGLSELKKMNLI